MFDKLREGLKQISDRLTQAPLSEKDLEPLLWDLQLRLLEGDVSLEVAERICGELKERLVGARAPRFGDRGELVRRGFREALLGVLGGSSFDLVEEVKRARGEGRPYVVLFVGINGTGKTTTIAKVAHLLKSRGLSVVLASGDTYRAGAIEQLEEHGRRLGVKVVRHRYGSDAAAVAVDAVEHAKAQGVDAVLIDTAGRMQTNRNLMDELRKVKRVVQPDLTVMVLDSLIGNDATEQAKTFNEELGFDAAILTKVDADAKGGSSLSVSYTTGKPIIYLGVGQGYEDLQPFDAQWLVERLLGDE